MLIFGIILLIIATILFFVARHEANHLHAMNAADTYTAHLLHEVHKKVTTSLGGDAMAQPCEITGTIECDTPLHGPLSDQACVAYTRTVTREYEEQVTEEDADGKRETRMERRSETVESEERRVKFWVRDATGRVLVDPDQADLDLIETGDRYEDAPEANRGRNRSRTLGFRHVEQALPVDINVYILGCAIDAQGQPMIARHPSDRKQKFFISRKSERELAQSAATWSRNYYYGTVGLGVAGLVFMVIGLFV